MYKLLLAILGYYLSNSFWGAIVGFLIGYMLDERSGSDNAKQDTDSAQRGYAYNRKKSGEAYQNQGRLMFLDALLELSAHIIQADGRIMHSEMETVREFLRQSFGPQTMEACNKRLLTIFQERKSLSEKQSWQRVYNSCQTLRMSMNQETCLQLMAYLAEIAKADGKIGNEEMTAMLNIASALGLSPSVVDQLLSLGGKSMEDAYRVLGIRPDASDDEVRRAYRKMALQYHPDRVVMLGDDIHESATRKFQEINDAKERIFKQRGL